MSTPIQTMADRLRQFASDFRKSRSLARMSTPPVPKSADRELDRAAELLQMLELERDSLIEALTPSADTKASYIGEFSWTVNNLEDDGSMDPVTYTVPWTTVKEIMAAIHKRADERAARARTAWAQPPADSPSRALTASR